MRLSDKQRIRSTQQFMLPPGSSQAFYPSGKMTSRGWVRTCCAGARPREGLDILLRKCVGRRVGRDLCLGTLFKGRHLDYWLVRVVLDCWEGVLRRSEG